MGSQVPIVDYLVFDDGTPYLNANACEECGALYFDRRNACAKCGKTAFGKKKLADRGKVASYTIVHRAAPNVQVPYVEHPDRPKSTRRGDRDRQLVGRDAAGHSGLYDRQFNS